ncbi:hypothetical protein CBR_g2721 [Chara braunii]|uniref:DDE Tnp4 domain-containing protein n=1 Tax=Chara braunii TaxID=69332 RepID=A0A388KDN5_CHABU|nr:hypothetical protein CBR_g2721 [Chara braunii]|eukprot:GBG68170.1 hypothetical protein CBR_g2721 [Chara braunii]
MVVPHPFMSELSVCLVGVRVTWTQHGDHRQWAEYLELLIIQAWRTEVEGNLLGFLFGSVRPDHRQPIVHELTVPLAQLADDLPLEIVSQSDDSPVPHVLTRTLASYLQWSACLKEPGSHRNPPSQRGYLDPHEIVDLAFFQDRTASENEEIEIEAEEVSSEEEEEVKEEADEEETPEEGSYSEHSEGEQSEAKEEEEQDDEEEEEDQEELEESEYEGFEEEVCDEARAQAQAQKREEIAVGKRQLEFASAAGQPRTYDLAWDPEPPKPEDGATAGETSAAPARLQPHQRDGGEADPPPPPPPTAHQLVHVLMRGIGLRPRSSGVTAVTDVANAILAAYPDKVAMPSGRRLLQVTRAFGAKGFPNCFGAIDCTHVYVDKPANAPSENYFDRKQQFSVVAQVVVDLHMRILDVFMGYPRSVHDQRVLRNSSLFRRAEAGELFVVEPVLLPGGVSTTGYLHGDNGYSPRMWMVVPYGGTDQAGDIGLFDTWQKTTRGVVERAFGRLKGMWRLILRHHKTNMDSLPQQFLVVCIIHNLLLEAGIPFDDSVLLEPDENGNLVRVDLGLQDPLRPVSQSGATDAALALRDGLRVRMMN